MHPDLGYPDPFGLEVVPRCSDKADNWNYPKYKYQHPHYTLSVLLALALAWILLVWRKQVIYRWLKYRSHYKIATIFIMKFMKIYKLSWVLINEGSDNQGLDNRGCTVTCNCYKWWVPVTLKAKLKRHIPIEFRDYWWLFKRYTYRVTVLGWLKKEEDEQFWLSTVSGLPL